MQIRTELIRGTDTADEHDTCPGVSGSRRFVKSVVGSAAPADVGTASAVASNSYGDSARFDAADEIYCQSHQSVYDPFSIGQESTVALPRFEGDE